MKKRKLLKVSDPSQKWKMTLMVIFTIGSAWFALKVVSLLEKISGFCV